MSSADEKLEDTKLLDAFDCFCRAIKIHAFGGTRTDKVFRWQVEMVGPADLRPTVRDAIRAAIGTCLPECDSYGHANDCPRGIAK